MGDFVCLSPYHILFDDSAERWAAAGEQCEGLEYSTSSFPTLHSLLCSISFSSSSSVYSPLDSIFRKVCTQRLADTYLATSYRTALMAFPPPVSAV